MKKVFVTGATGQTGSFFCEYLLELGGYEVVAGVRRTSQDIFGNLKNCINHKNFRIVPFDLTDSCSITSAIKQEKPDIFLNLGAQTFVADSWHSPALHMETNAISIIHILEAIRNYCIDCRVLSMGSSEMFGDVKSPSQDETHPMSPRSIYGVSKVAAKFICKIYRESYGMYVAHATSFNKESHRRQKYFVTRKITSAIPAIYQALKNKTSFNPIELGNVDSKRDWSHSKDFVDGLFRMMFQEEYNKNFPRLPKEGLSEREKTAFYSKHIQEYVLSSNETHSIREFVELAFANSPIPKTIEGKFYWRGSGLDEQYVLENATGLIEVLVKINPKFFRPADVELLLGDSNRIRSELGWKPKYSFSDLVKEMVDYDINNPNE